LAVISYIEGIIKTPLSEVILRSDDKNKTQIPYMLDGTIYQTREGREGYLRLKNSRIEPNSFNALQFINKYALVLFLPMNTCEADILNIAANVETARVTNMKREYEIKVVEIFFESIKNINLEFKIDLFPNYRTIIMDLEVIEPYCKTKIECND